MSVTLEGHGKAAATAIRQDDDDRGLVYHRKVCGLSGWSCCKQRFDIDDVRVKLSVLTVG
jgi:phosphohistidine phosphatase SixA